MFPRLTPFYDGLMANRLNWERLWESNGIGSIDESELESIAPSRTPSVFSKISSSSESLKEINKKTTKTGARSPKTARSRSPKAPRSPQAVRKSPLTPKKRGEHSDSSSPLKKSSSPMRSSNKEGHGAKAKTRPATHANGKASKSSTSSPVGIFPIFIDWRHCRAILLHVIQM